MASQWQERVNARNAAKSTGPKTRAGKEASSRNATTHGHYSLKADDRSGEPDFDAERRLWIDTFSPENKTVADLASDSFLKLRRMRRLLAAEDAAVAENARTASDRFDLERREAIDDAETNLIDKPYANYLLLTSTTIGCDRMLAIVDRLEEKLAMGTWDAPCLALLRAVRGKGRESTDRLLEAASETVVRLQSPEPTPSNDIPDRLVDEALGLDVAEPAPPKPAPTLPERDAARLEKSWEILLTRIDEERTELELIKEELADEDRESRRLFIIQAQFDFSPEGRALERGLVQATNAFHKSFDLLNKAAQVDLSKVSGPLSPKRAAAPIVPPAPAAAPSPSSPPKVEATRPVPPPPPAVRPSPSPPAPKRNEPKERRADFVDLSPLSAPLNIRVGSVPRA